MAQQFHNHGVRTLVVLAIVLDLMVIQGTFGSPLPNGDVQYTVVAMDIMPNNESHDRISTSTTLRPVPKPCGDGLNCEDPPNYPSDDEIATALGKRYFPPISDVTQGTVGNGDVSYTVISMDDTTFGPGPQPCGDDIYCEDPPNYPSDDEIARALAKGYLPPISQVK